MKRKFTFLLMALLALTSFKSWGQQRGYTYTQLTGLPESGVQYYLGYQSGDTWYLYVSGNGSTGNPMVLGNENSAKPFDLSQFPGTNYCTAKCEGQDLMSNTLGSAWGNRNVFDASQGYINFIIVGQALYHNANNEITTSGNSTQFINFYKRTGSSAPTYTVTVTSDTEGCTASADKASYEEGETVTLSYEADAFHYFVEWQSSDVTITGNTFEMPANDVSVTAHFAAKPTHSITVTVNPENTGTASVTYGGDPITQAPAGAVLNLSAVPNTGYDFVSWTIGDEVVSTNANYNYTMPDNNVAIVANFGEHQFLHVNIDPYIVGGTITVNPSECDPGTTVTVTANAASGYQYVYGNITVTDANGQPVYVYQGYPSSTFTMPSTDVTVSATFSKSYYISIGTQQHCMVTTSPMGSATANATVTVFVTPEEGYRVTNVTAIYADGEITAVYSDEWEGQFMYDFTMPAADVTVNVVCAQTYTVSYTQPEGGYIYVSPTTYVPAGQEVSIDITQIYDHYSFDYANYASKISVKDASQEAVIVNKESDGHYYFLMPASNVTVSVTFDQDANYDIAVTQPEGCTIEVSPSENVYADEPVYLYYSNVESGYQFVEWVVKDGESTIELYNYYGTYYFIMPASEDVTVTATVQALTAHTVNIAEGITGGSISARTDNDHEAPINAYAGEYVYLTNTPEPGYQFVSYTVTSECETVEVYYDYYFIMPDCDVTVSADFEIAPQNLTVNDGTATNQTIPTTTAQTWYSTKSQFIIPFEQLQNMYDGTITDMTFYADFNNFDFGEARWNVYVKEVDYQTLNDYVSTEGMTLVYNGGMTIANGQMHIEFTNDYEYSDNNLLIYFEQIQAGSCTDWKNWYGVNTSKATAYAGYDFGSGQWENYHYAQWFLPKTTFRYMPSANPQTRYNIVVNNPEGTTITASKTMATQGTIITLSKSLEEGYVFNNWVVMQGETPVAVENDQFEMPAGAVTVTADVTAPTYYNVYLDPSTAYTIYADPVEHILAGKTITLSDAAESGKTVDAWTVTEHTSGTPVEVTFNDNYNCYQFTMPEDDVDVTATFRDLKECTINFYVNGVKWEEGTENVLEDEWVYLYEIRPETIPAGTTFTGWATSEIETYQTTYPEDLKYSFRVKDNMDLYAVFNFTEKVPTGESRWSQLTMLSQLEDGDEIAFTCYDWVDGGYHLLAQRSNEDATDFGRTDGMSWNDLNQGNFPEGAIVFTAINNAGSWNFMYEDEFVEGTSALAINSYGSMGPNSYIGGYDNWSIYSNDGTWTSGYTYNIETNNYINFDDSRFYGGAYNNAASLYRKEIITHDNNYYMTSVLGFAGADEHIVSNTEATNVVIAKNAKLTIDNGATLNVEGICLSASHDAAQLVIADGGQLIHNNAGTVATMKKNIAEANTRDSKWSDWYTISSPLANSVEFANVENLIPTTVETDDYDLYRLDEKYGIWENARVTEGVAFTTIDKGRGYLYARKDNAQLAFAGEINVANVECTLTNDATNGFNLIGNPFAQNITLENVTNVTLAEGFYVLTNQDTWGTEPSFETIAPLQGFLVQATTAGTATISKPTAAPSKGERSEQSTNIEMIVSNSTYRDNAFAMFGEGIGLNKVNHRNAQAPMLYVPQDGEKFAIAFMDENTTVFPLNFKAMTTGNYSISLKATDDINTLVLVDNMTGVETNMLLEGSYSFIGSPADNDSRFTVKLSISHNSGQADSEHFVYQNGSELVVNGEGTLHVFDVLGRVVISEEVHGQTVNVGGLTTGAYIVRMTGNEVKTQKIIIR